ncbi:MAG TPA: tetratricopeptide repeat protein [Pyrinomonadaceae bacterium]|nr:tetratricopeptide repeat protein [Pyrinomonadaceae bacterium]
MKRLFAILVTAFAVFTFSAAITPTALAQSRSAETIVVLPFENRSPHPEYNWIGESFADSLATLLNKPDMIVVSTPERALAYQRLNLPLTVLPSRATAIKIGRELKASMVVVGNYEVTPAPKDDKAGKDANVTTAWVAVQARVIRVNEGRLAGDVMPSGVWAWRAFDTGAAVNDLQKMHGHLAYQILYQYEKARCPNCTTPPLGFSREDLVQEATRVPSRAFEALIKGLLTPAGDPTREVFLKNALKVYEKEKGGAVYPLAAFELGRFYFNQAKFKESAEYMLMVPKDDARFGEAQFFAGLAYWKAGEIQKAANVLVPLADQKLMPLVAVYNNAAAVSIEAARAEKKSEERARLLNQAIALLTRAADSSPDDTTVLFNYAYALFLEGRHLEAAEKIEKVVAADQRDGQAYFLLAKARERGGNADMASAADNQARIYMQASYAKWQDEWQRSQTISKLNARSRDVLNQVDVSDLARRKQLDAQTTNVAEQMLVKIRELYQQGRDDEALAELKKLLVVEPTNPEAYFLTGQIKARTGDQETAIAQLKTAIFWDPSPRMVEAHILLGKIFLERGDLGEAKKYAASADTLDPNNPEVLALKRQVTMGRP